MTHQGTRLLLEFQLGRFAMLLLYHTALRKYLNHYLKLL
jgi:hypothetical protein